MSDFNYYYHVFNFFWEREKVWACVRVTKHWRWRWLQLLCWMTECPWIHWWLFASFLHWIGCLSATSFTGGKQVRDLMQRRFGVCFFSLGLFSSLKFRQFLFCETLSIVFFYIILKKAKRNWFNVRTYSTVSSKKYINFLFQKIVYSIIKEWW